MLHCTTGRAKYLLSLLAYKCHRKTTNYSGVKIVRKKKLGFIFESYQLCLQVGYLNKNFLIVNCYFSIDDIEACWKLDSALICCFSFVLNDTGKLKKKTLFHYHWC